MLALPILLNRSTWAVPALENESLVVAEVLDRSLIDAAELAIQPEQKLWRFRLRVISVEDVAGNENFLRGQQGQTIEVYSNQANAPVAAEKLVNWRISFQGDERNGRYWLIGTVQGKSK